MATDKITLQEAARLARNLYEESQLRRDDMADSESFYSSEDLFIYCWICEYADWHINYYYAIADNVESARKFILEENGYRYSDMYKAFIIKPGMKDEGDILSDMGNIMKCDPDMIMNIKKGLNFSIKFIA